MPLELLKRRPETDNKFVIWSENQGQNNTEVENVMKGLIVCTYFYVSSLFVRLFIAFSNPVCTVPFGITR
jgi:hypothetical protein